MKLLYIEDDRQLSATLGEFLEMEEGWEVVRAYRPEEAIEILKDREAEIDGILLDVMMPPDDLIDDRKSDYGQNTGVLLLDHIQEITRTPVIVLSARQNLDYLKEQGRVAEYLKKTLNPVTIVERIKGCLEDTSLKLTKNDQQEE